jgi:hypothetical protein
MNTKLMERTAAIILCWLILASLSCERIRTPRRYLIPDGYVGWVNIYFNVNDAPPTPIEGGAYEFVIASNGELCTASPVEYGHATDEFYYTRRDARVPVGPTDPDGEVQLWEWYGGHLGGCDGTSHIVVSFWVGTRKQHDNTFRWQQQGTGAP